MKLYEKSVNFDIVIHSLSYHFHTLLWLLGAGWGFVHQSKCGQFKIVIDDTKHVNRPKFKSMYVKFWRTWLKPVMKFSLGWFPRINSNSRLTLIDQPFNPISTGTGQNQPIYEYHLTTAGRNRVKDMHISQNVTRGWVFLFLTFAPGGRGQGNSNFYNLWLLMIPTKGCPHQGLKGRS